METEQDKAPGEAFDPRKHFRTLKGNQYLDVKWRVVWFREQHPDGVIDSTLLFHDHTEGRAVFRAVAQYTTSDGDSVAATGHAQETRGGFADYLEKSETAAIGRALAFLGYGTADALDLDESTALADSPVTPTQAPAPAPAQRQGRASLAAVPDPRRDAALRAEISAALEHDAEAAARLPKEPAAMNHAELTKTWAWLTRRAKALS